MISISFATSSLYSCSPLNTLSAVSTPSLTRFARSQGTWEGDGAGLGLVYWPCRMRAVIMRALSTEVRIAAIGREVGRGVMRGA